MAKPKSNRDTKTELTQGYLSRILALLSLTDRQGLDDPKREKHLAIGFLIVVVTLLLLPFISRAFHVDDPLFIWAAKHIQTNPADPYAFNVNWYGDIRPMWDVTKNPPITSYYIAGAASILGWSEVSLHIAFLFPSLAVVIGMFLIAQRFCKRPLVAALAGTLTPVFFVSSLTVMSDMMMLAFWVFAVHFWIKGLETKSHAAFAVAGVLIALSALTKYFGMTLIPLLLLYSIVKERRVGVWLVYFLIPVVALAWYQMTTQQLYGRGLLLDAAEYATGTQAGFGKFNIPKTYINFAFIGGCVASVLFFTRQLWSRPVIIAGLVFAVVVAFIVSSSKTLGSFPLPTDITAHRILAVQLGVWGAAGIGLVILSVLDLYRHKDADSLLLFLWIIGTLLFAGFVNWTTNGRSILPMIIPAGILIVRQLDRQPQPKRRKRIPAVVLPLLGAAVVSIAVLWADSSLAESARKGAAAIRATYPGDNRTVWFQGHWGFQYYMEQLGAKAMDVTHWSFATGDVVAIPTTNTNTYAMPKEWVAVREMIDIPSSGWIATMNPYVGAGFYADIWGPLPFALGTVAAERFTIFDVGPQPR